MPRPGARVVLAHLVIFAIDVEGTLGGHDAKAVGRPGTGGPLADALFRRLQGAHRVHVNHTRWMGQLPLILVVLELSGLIEYKITPLPGLRWRGEHRAMSRRHHGTPGRSTARP